MSTDLTTSYLRCQVAAHPREPNHLVEVSFSVGDTDQRATVPSHLVQHSGDGTWVGVQVERESGDRVLISIPEASPPLHHVWVSLFGIRDETIAAGTLGSSRSR